MFTGVNLLPDAVETLAAHPNIVGMKESGGDIAQIAEYVARTPDDFTRARRLGDARCSMRCAPGATARSSRWPHSFPTTCVQLWTLVREGRLDEARALQRRLLPLARSVGGAHGIPGLKAALDLMGFSGGVSAAAAAPGHAGDGRRRSVDQLEAAGRDTGTPVAELTSMRTASDPWFRVPLRASFSSRSRVGVRHEPGHRPARVQPDERSAGDLARPGIRSADQAGDGRLQRPRARSPTSAASASASPRSPSGRICRGASPSWTSRRSTPSRCRAGSSTSRAASCLSSTTKPSSRASWATKSAT